GDPPVGGSPAAGEEPPASVITGNLDQRRAWRAGDHHLRLADSPLRPVPAGELARNRSGGGPRGRGDPESAVGARAHPERPAPRGRLIDKIPGRANLLATGRDRPVAPERSSPAWNPAPPSPRRRPRPSRPGIRTPASR